MKLSKWQLQEAKNKFSEVVRRAISEGPQTVTKHGKDSVVVVSAEEFRKSHRSKDSLVDFFQQSPLASVNLSLKRDKSKTRNISL